MLNNLFGEKKAGMKDIIEHNLSRIIEAGPFLLSFEITQIEEEENSFKIDIFGEDEGLLKNKGGKLLIALQTYILRSLQNAFPEQQIFIAVDSNEFWKEAEEKLLSLTDHLIAKAIDTKSSVKFRKALSPKQRRLVHERASGNTGVRSNSLGEGFYKIIEITPDEVNG